MKKLILLLSVAFLTIMGASADTYNYLNFVTANNQITQVSTTGLKMTFNAGNAAELLSKPDIDGGLIGGASLKPDFGKIVNYNK